MAVAFTNIESTVQLMPERLFGRNHRFNLVLGSVLDVMTRAESYSLYVANLSRATTLEPFMLRFKIKNLQRAASFVFIESLSTNNSIELKVIN